MKRFFFLSLMLPCVLVTTNYAASPSSGLKATGLTAEYLTDPLGVETPRPRLSWRIESGKQGTFQAAYEIRVWKADGKPVSGDFVWQSGKVDSDESLHREYGGEPLVSGTGYRWQVRVWDTQGNVSPWSETAFWQMGLLRPGDWKGTWIGLDTDYKEPEDDHRRLPARMLRHEFALGKKIVRATAYFSGLGFSELYLNGKKVDQDRIMDPAHGDYDERVPYVVHDVTGYLKPGDNCVGAILGNGRFFSPRVRIPVATPSFGFPKMRLQIQVEYADGTSELIVSGGDWKITDQGPIRSNSEFDGEEYDARMEQDGWNRIGFDDSRWLPVQLVGAPSGTLYAQIQEPMRIIETCRPVAISPAAKDAYLVDFGQNLYGMCRIRVQGPAGTEITIRSTFDLDSTGNIDMTMNRSALSEDRYTLRGKGTEQWAPRFRGQGTRYVEVRGWPGKLTPDDIELLVVHSDLRPVGTFSCSNDLVNKIYANLVRSVRMQERGLPMDPDRDERQAWLSVSEMTSETEGYLYNVAAFYENFLAETRANQREDGCLSDAGSLWDWAYTKDPCWPSVITTTPWSNHRMYGDVRVLEENYPVMKRWMACMEANIDSDYIYRKGIYSDWVDAYTMDDLTGNPPFGNTPKELVSTAYFYYNMKLLERTALFLGKPEDAPHFRETARRVKDAFNREFFDPQTGTYRGNTQAGYAMALEFGLVPEGHTKQVADRLVANIMEENNGHLTVGCPGTKWLMQCLTHIGRTDVAYTVLTQTTRPSWGYMVSVGGTSIWERWDCDTQSPGMNGQSQTILAGYLGAWMYQTLGGIAYDPEHPGFRHIVMNPEPTGDLKWVDCSFESLYGRIESNWKCGDGVFDWNITIPANCRATVRVPADSADSVKESGEAPGRRSGIRFVGYESGCAVYEIVPGDYRFSSAYTRK